VVLIEYQTPVQPSSVPVGAVCIQHKMGFGSFKYYTIQEMVNSSHKTIHGQTAGSYLRWICTKDGSFNWTWTNVKHVQLLWGWDAYSKRKQKGHDLDVIVDSHGTKMKLHVQHIMDSYSLWLHNLGFFDSAHDGNPDDTGHTAESDVSDTDEDDMKTIFPTDNTVSRGTLDFFQQVKGMQDKPYCIWSTLWARAPHTTCVSDPHTHTHTHTHAHTHTHTHHDSLSISVSMFLQKMRERQGILQKMRHRPDSSQSTVSILTATCTKTVTGFRIPRAIGHYLNPKL
jgi:hypothetical protein